MAFVKRYEPDQQFGTIEVMNDLGSFLLRNGLIKCVDRCGVQEASDATCVFEVHVIKKRV